MKKLSAVVNKSGEYFIFEINNFNKPYKIYYSTSNTIENKKLLTEDNKSKLKIKSPINNNRLFFEVICEEQTTGIFSTRLVDVESIENFRDLGGYITEDNKVVKWGYFYRCGSLGEVSERDKEYLENMKISTIFDFRSEMEVSAQKDIELSNCKYINESGIKNLDDNLKSKENFDMKALMMEMMKDKDKLKGFDSILLDGYRVMVEQNEAFKILFDTIKNPDRLPLVFHCTAGKDRTGVAGALILLALGVSEDKVIEDYCLSNIYREATNEAQLNEIRKFIDDEQVIEIIKGVFMVKREYLMITLDKIKESYSSYVEYIINALGVSEKELEIFRKKYLA